MWSVRWKLEKDEPLTHGGDSADVSNFAVQLPQPYNEATITAMELATTDSNGKNIRSIRSVQRCVIRTSGERSRSISILYSSAERVEVASFKEITS